MRSKEETLEVWLRGPSPDMLPHLQGVAHALLQAREEVFALTADFSPMRCFGRSPLAPRR